MRDSVVFYDCATVFFGRSVSLVNEPGIPLFRKTLDLLSRRMAPIDRTGTIKFPVRMQLLPGLGIPTPGPTDDFQTIGIKRARTLMEQAIRASRRIAILWSGGIDSTFVLACFLMACTNQEMNKHAVVLLSNESLQEHPAFFESFIRGKLPIGHSKLLETFLGNPEYLVVTGEGSDQLFGSQLATDGVLGDTPWDVPSTSEKIISVFSSVMDHREAESAYLILDRVRQAAPIPIETVYSWFWWMNFSLKWQSVLMRIAAYTMHRIVPQEDLTMFFLDDDFQRWSMNLRGGTGGTDHKRECRDAIFSFDGDNSYRDNKVKQGSLWKILIRADHAVVVDGNLDHHKQFDTTYLDPNNDFII